MNFQLKRAIEYNGNLDDTTSTPKFNHQYYQPQPQQQHEEREILEQGNDEGNEHSPPRDPDALAQAHQRLQQQHHVPHSKYHSMEKFAVVSSESTATGVAGVMVVADKQPVVSATPDYDHEQLDLTELDENERKEIQEQQDFFEKGGTDTGGEAAYNTQLHRHYIQLQILYKARGRKMNELASKVSVLQDEMEREMRAMTHKQTMIEREREDAVGRLDQAAEREARLTADLDSYIRVTNERSHEIEQLKKVFIS